MRFRRRGGSDDGNPPGDPRNGGERGQGGVPPLVAMAVDAAAELGYQTKRYDPDRRILVVEGLGEVPLGPVLDRSDGLTEAQQRPKMRSAITRAVRNAPRAVDDRHAGLPGHLVESLQRSQATLELQPGDPGPHQAIGRIERSAGIAGWEQAIARAAQAYERQAADGLTVDGHLGAASMYRLLGDSQRAHEHAEQVVASVDTTWRENSYNPSLAVLAAALILADRRAELPVLAEREGQPRLGPLWWPLCHAAGAAEHGDVQAVSHVADDLRAMAADEPVGWDGPSLPVRDLVEIVDGWVRALS